MNPTSFTLSDQKFLTLGNTGQLISGTASLKYSIFWSQSSFFLKALWVREPASPGSFLETVSPPTWTSWIRVCISVRFQKDLHDCEFGMPPHYTAASAALRHFPFCWRRKQTGDRDGESLISGWGSRVISSIWELLTGVSWVTCPEIERAELR